MRASLYMLGEKSVVDLVYFETILALLNEKKKQKLDISVEPHNHNI